MVLRKSFYIRWSAGRSPRVHEVNPGRDPSVYLVSLTMGKSWDCVKPKSIHSFGIVAYNLRLLAFGSKFGIFRPYTWYFSNY